MSNSAPGVPLLVVLSSLLIQWFLGRFFPRLGALSRRTLAPWLAAVAWSAAGFRAATMGNWAFVGLRVFRLSDVVCVLHQGYPRVLEPRPAPSAILLSSGKKIHTALPHADLADFLGVPLSASY